MADELSDRVVFKQLNDEQKHELVVQINAEEVKRAVFAMHPDKVPGVDGLNPSFFQAYWDIVGQDVWKLCQVFFDIGELPFESKYYVSVFDPKSKTATESGRP